MHVRYRQSKLSDNADDYEFALRTFSAWDHTIYSKEGVKDRRKALCMELKVKQVLYPLLRVFTYFLDSKLCRIVLTQKLYFDLYIIMYYVMQLIRLTWVKKYGNLEFSCREMIKYMLRRWICKDSQFLIEVMMLIKSRMACPLCVRGVLQQLKGLFLDYCQVKYLILSDQITCRGFSVAHCEVYQNASPFWVLL